MKEKFYSTVIAFFKKGVEPTNKFVTALVNAEGCYINTAHPEFVNGHRAVAMVNEKLQLNKPQATTETNKDGTQRKVPPTPASQQPTTYNLDSSDQGYFSSFFAKKTTKKPGVLEAPPAVLKATGTVSEKEYIEIEVIKLLLNFYYHITTKTIADMVL